MTAWSPALDRFPGPRYRAIADALSADVVDGVLAPGTRLPTHRDLAWRLGVTIGTVSRAYAEAERRGLIAGEIGRGTYVRAVEQSIQPGPRWDRSEAPGFVDFGFNVPSSGGDDGALLAATLKRLAGTTLDGLLNYHSPDQRGQDRAAGAAWIARRGLAPVPEQVILTNGGQHGVATILSVLVRPGDLVAVECLTYPGIRALAELMGLRLIGLAMDDDGLLPDAFDAACRERPVKVLYSMPTLHNPLAMVMSEGRRRAIAEIARRHDVPVIEDDVLGFLAPAVPTPLAALAPEQGFYVASTSKCMAPGLRVGYVHAPASAVPRLSSALRATTYMPAPLTSAIAAAWIADGTADRLVAAKRAVCAERGRLAASCLPAEMIALRPDACHFLVTPPASWSADAFAAAARRRGVGLTPLAAFTVDRGAASALVPANALRLCFGTPQSEAETRRGLAIVAELLASEPEVDLAVI